MSTFRRALIHFVARRRSLSFGESDFGRKEFVFQLGEFVRVDRRIVTPPPRRSSEAGAMGTESNVFIVGLCSAPTKAQDEPARTGPKIDRLRGMPTCSTRSAASGIAVSSKGGAPASCEKMGWVDIPQRCGSCVKREVFPQTLCYVGRGLLAAGDTALCVGSCGIGSRSGPRGGMLRFGRGLQ